MIKNSVYIMFVDISSQYRLTRAINTCYHSIIIYMDKQGNTEPTLPLLFTIVRENNFVGLHETRSM